jgi:hypothetical protein
MHKANLTLVKTDQEQKNEEPTSDQQDLLGLYQIRFLEEMKKHPSLVKILSLIFIDYKDLLIKEYKMTAVGTSKRQQNKAQEVIQTINRLESYLEAEIAKLYGVDAVQILNDVKKEIENNTENNTENNSEIVNSICSENENLVE